MVRPSLDTLMPTTIKFLCRYGGKILPRYPDGKICYVGGETRVLAVDRSISFSDLLMKFGDVCATSVSLRCQLPAEDLDALVTITSDEELANLIEEYDLAASPPSSLKIRAFLSPPKTDKKATAPRPSSSASASASASSLSKSSSSSTSSSHSPTGSTQRFKVPVAETCFRQLSSPMAYQRSAPKIHPHCAYHAHGNPRQTYLVHDGNYGQ